MFHVGCLMGRRLRGHSQKPFGHAANHRVHNSFLKVEFPLLPHVKLLNEPIPRERLDPPGEQNHAPFIKESPVGAESLFGLLMCTLMWFPLDGRTSSETRPSSSRGWALHLIMSYSAGSITPARFVLSLPRPGERVQRRAPKMHRGSPSVKQTLRTYGASFKTKQQRTKWVKNEPLPWNAACKSGHVTPSGLLRIIGWVGVRVQNVCKPWWKPKRNSTTIRLRVALHRRAGIRWPSTRPLFIWLKQNMRSLADLNL